MAKEEQKKQNQLRLTSMILTSLAAGVWDTLGESSFSLSGPIGNVVVSMMEKEMGLEIAGESPADVLNEIGRIFVDEFGFAQSITVEGTDEELLRVKVRNCVNRNFSDKLLEAGVEKPFICPIMNACQASLRRMGFKMRESIEKWEEGGGSIITFRGI